MPAHKKETPERYCEFCGKKLERKHLPNGDLEYLIHFGRRKFCDQMCMAKSFTGRELTPTEEAAWSTAHARARKICPKGPCVKCGKQKARDVHHKDENWRNNDPSNLERICRSCHGKEHRERSTCTICGKPQKGLGFCEMHYQRFKKWGDPLAVKINQHTPLSQSQDAVK